MTYNLQIGSECFVLHVCSCFLDSTVGRSLITSNNEESDMLVSGANKVIGKAICQLLLSWKITPDIHFLLKSRDAKRGEQAVQDTSRRLFQVVRSIGDGSN